MTHIRSISCAPAPAQVTGIEQLILTILQVYFSDWDNFPSVLQNLQKFYSKTD